MKNIYVTDQILKNPLFPEKQSQKKEVSTNNNFTSTLDRLQPKSLSSKKGKIVNCPKVLKKYIFLKI